MASLSVEDKQRIKDSLELFFPNIEHNMLKFYSTFLSTYPQYMPMFYSLKGVTPDPDNLMKNEWLRQQGPRFASAIVSLVHNMEDSSALVEDISQMVSAPRHTKHNLTTEDYMIALNTFVDNLKKVLEPNVTQADVEAWRRFLAKLELIFESELKKVTADQTHKPLGRTNSRY